MTMETNRELWSSAYKFYQEQVKLLESSRSDIGEYFCGLTVEISRRCSESDAECAEMWKCIYAMLEARAKKGQ